MQGLELTEPLWATLLAFIFLGFFLRNRGYFIKKSYAQVAQKKGTARAAFFRRAVPLLSAAIALILITAALVDITRGYALVKEELSVNRIFVAIDNSSSMYRFQSGAYGEGLPPITCADKNLQQEFPRIFGACRALHRLVDEVEAFARRKKEQQKDQVALVRFALYSFAQVPLTNDYNRLRAAIEGMNWRDVKSLGINTEIHLALRDLYRLAFERNRDPGGTFVHLSFEDAQELARALAADGSVAASSFSPPRRLTARATTGETGEQKSIVERLKEEMRDTVFIIVTDAAKGQLESRLHTNPVSLKKMMQFAALLELPVYFISTDEANAEYKRMARKTGFSLNGIDYHGDFLVVRQDIGYDHIEELMAAILGIRFGRKTLVKTERRESYAGVLSLAALTFLGFGVCFRETVGRSLTDA